MALKHVSIRTIKRRSDALLIAGTVVFIFEILVLNLWLDWVLLAAAFAAVGILLLLGSAYLSGYAKAGYDVINADIYKWDKEDER